MPGCKVWSSRSLTRLMTSSMSASRALFHSAYIGGRLVSGTDRRAWSLLAWSQRDTLERYTSPTYRCKTTSQMARYTAYSLSAMLSHEPLGANASWIATVAFLAAHKQLQWAANLPWNTGMANEVSDQSVRTQAGMGEDALADASAAHRGSAGGGTAGMVADLLRGRVEEARRRGWRLERDAFGIATQPLRLLDCL